MDEAAGPTGVEELVRLRWLGLVLNGAAVICAAAAYVVAAQAGRASGDDRTRLLFAGALLAGGTVLFGVLQQLRTARRLRTAEQVAVDAEEELTLALNGALGPITNYLGELADAPTTSARAKIAGQLRQAVADAAVRLTAPGSRGAFYAVDDTGTLLSREVYAGRAALPRAAFVAGTASGDAVLDLVRRGDLVFVQDVTTDPMVEPSPGAGYGTVVAAAVSAGSLRFGMLTVDAPAAGDLSTTDVELVRVLANLLGSGLAQARW